ncbi:MAG: RNA methyltransferase [Thermoplasmata archaeon]|nr:RNA methyltransferase [Thermoplasmata archaeon]
MPEICVILVKPQNEGNIGALARSMMNFGLQELRLVSPECAIGIEAKKRAMHAQAILENAKIFKKLDKALVGIDMVVGTSGVRTENDKKFGRIAQSPREFSKKIKNYRGKIALLFGQEDFGLDRETVMRCDLLVTIPASEEYPIMNVSHAASIVFYELYLLHIEKWESKSAGKMEINRLAKQFRSLLDISEYPEHKRVKTTVMFRRIIGRAVLSKWEYHTMMGALKEAIRKIKKE